MSALDQAFIRAYQEECATPVAASPDAARPAEPPRIPAEPIPREHDVALSVDAWYGQPADPMVSFLEEPPKATASPPKRNPPEAAVAPTLDALDREETDSRPPLDAAPTFLRIDRGTTRPSPPKAESLGILAAFRAAEDKQDVELPEMVPVGEAAVDVQPIENIVEPEVAATPQAEHPSVQASPRVPASLRPMLQVDRVSWPEVCERLAKAATGPLDDVADALERAVVARQKIVGVCSHERGEGCTTTLAAAALRMLARGLRVAVVDADLAEPQLAQRLALLPEIGWEEVVAGTMPLAEVMIESLADGLVVLPWCGPRTSGGETLLSHPPRTGILDPLRSQYDLVLVDLGAIGRKRGSTGESAACSGAPWLDAVVLVRDVRHTPRQHLTQIQEYLEAANVPQAGMAENFAA